ncbi:MAG: ACR3 family arsenite efflux transporter, partial [bacterium]|nr:ACR3 family arsenite efflux transporter [bacterium]
DLASLRHIGARPKGLTITIIVNWLIKPFTMVGLGLVFFEVIFEAWVSPAEAREYIAGMILLGAAPCTAMVFVWSHLTRGDATYTLVQVSVNDLIMVFAFAPLVALLLGVADVIVPWSTLLLSVVLYVVVPLVAGYFTRRALIGQGGDGDRIAAFSAKLKPYTIVGLLATIVLLFAFQGPRILEQPLLIALIAVPLLVQSYGIFLIGYGWAWAWGLPYSIAAPAALIGTSNFFELAVAVAISLFGLESGAALTTVVGVLVEVPVMLSLVALANRTQGHFSQPKLAVQPDSASDRGNS